MFALSGYTCEFNLVPALEDKINVNMESDSGLGTTSGEDADLMQADQ